MHDDHTNRFAIWKPRFWWTVRKSERPQLTDPDVSDQRVRWRNNPEVDWLAVAQFVNQVANQLDRDDVFADLSRYNDDGELLWVDCDAAQLPDLEQNIVRAWFTSGIPPTFDPWHHSMTDGRHRLWNVWQADPEARVPVQSLILRSAVIGEAPIREHRNYPSLLREVSWFDASVGANRRYAVNLHWAMQQGNYFVPDHRQGPSATAKVEDFPVPNPVPIAVVAPAISFPKPRPLGWFSRHFKGQPADGQAGG
ncbi:hypothetical protein [Nocardia goodfellowii]|uniref:DNA primase/polymerase bifunctional N-terminal domain-containing protein n=1 Tax=Nocardia goodfellowii TaxID=882446 RepID=A0ABS4QPG4_9NOCA|nr:hypothetical protein [Nocardia goodfellowii]MBP2193612.1 hypothetical protein [Nocardia goodfellowii]